MSSTTVPSHDDIKDRELKRAARELGVSPGSLTWHFVDWGVDVWYKSGGGTIALTNSVVTCASTSSAGTSAYAIIGTSGTTISQFAPGGSDAVFYVSARMRLTTAIDSATYAGVGAASEVFVIGANGAGSAAKFAFATATGTLASTLDADTTWRTHRVKRVGGATTYTIDDANSVAGTNYGTNPQGLAVFASNGATAAVRGAACDWVFVASPREV